MKGNLLSIHHSSLIIPHFFPRPPSRSGLRTFATFSGRERNSSGWHRKNFCMEKPEMKKCLMFWRRTALVALTLGCLLAAQGAAFAQQADKAAKMDELLRAYQSSRQFNGAVLVAEGGKVIFKKGYGPANMEWEVANEADTKFRLGSITKQFTATLVMQLVEQGKLRLDAKLTDYLPDYRKETGGRITIHQLLNHTSGIPSYTSRPDLADISRASLPVAEFVKRYAAGDLEFEPGSKFSYNTPATSSSARSSSASLESPTSRFCASASSTPSGLRIRATTTLTASSRSAPPDTRRRSKAMRTRPTST